MKRLLEIESCGMCGYFDTKTRPLWFCDHPDSKVSGILAAHKLPDDCPLPKAENHDLLALTDAIAGLADLDFDIDELEKWTEQRSKDMENQRPLPKAGWVSVEDELPGEMQAVLVKGGVAFRTGGEWKTMMEPGWPVIQWLVTEWMHLPEPPKEI